MDTPDALIDTYKRWNRAGRPSQVRSRWKLDPWVRRLPQYEHFLRSLPQEELGRDDAIALVGEVTDEDSAVRAFLLAMIWGYGPVGYGPYRTQRVLDSPKASARLLEIARLAQGRGGLTAFQHIESQRREQRSFLKFLGPAFGTKFLYFLTASSGSMDTTPVMDAVVWRWFRKNVTGASINVLYWDSESYATSLDHLQGWSRMLVGDDDRSLDLDDVEYLIFAAGVDFESNREWSEEWEREPGPVSVSDLLDQLRAISAADPDIGRKALQLLDELEGMLGPKVEVLESES